MIARLLRCSRWVDRLRGYLSVLAKPARTETPPPARPIAQRNGRGHAERAGHGLPYEDCSGGVEAFVVQASVSLASLRVPQFSASELMLREQALRECEVTPQSAATSRPAAETQFLQPGGRRHRPRRRTGTEASRNLLLRFSIFVCHGLPLGGSRKV